MISASGALSGSYDYSEVAKSVLIAIVASYAALDLAGRVTATRGRVRLAWLTGGAIAMGIGIWAMHFKGMLAFRLPVPVEYHWPTVLGLTPGGHPRVCGRAVCGEPPQNGSRCGFDWQHIHGRGHRRHALHRHGRNEITSHYPLLPLLVTCSILLAILFCLIALLLAFDLREETRWSVPRRLGSATVMGVAVSAMHYTGMAAARFIPASPPDLSNGHRVFTGFIRDISEKQRAEDELRKQKEVFQKIFEHIPVTIAFVGQDGHLDLVNPEWERTIGWTLEEIRKQNLDLLAEFYPDPQYRQWVLGLIAASTGEWTDRKVRVRDGRVIDLAVAVVHLSDGTSVAIGRDITERKRAEAELRESEARFRLVADSAPVMIWMSGTDKLCTYFNEPWLDFTGRSLEQELGNGWAEGVDLEDSQRCLDTYAQAFDRREAFRMEYRLRRRDGEFRWVLDIGVPRFNPDGSFAGYIGSCIDVTEQRRAEEQLHQAQEDLARVTRVVSMGELAAAIAHEVNQPLIAIVTNGQFCLRRLDGATSNPDELRAAITGIVNDGTRASAVISRIRGLLMKGSPNRTELDINQTIQYVTILLRKEFTRNRVSLGTELASDLPRVTGDPVQLQQVLINLIMNAIEATRTSTNGRREILIRSAKNPDGVLVQVQDSGPGIELELANRIFEPFFTTKAKGIGMGLSISHSIIESHGGRLGTTPSSTGALFEFTLPTDDAGVS